MYKFNFAQVPSWYRSNFYIINTYSRKYFLNIYSSQDLSYILFHFKSVLRLNPGRGFE